MSGEQVSQKLQVLSIVGRSYGFFFRNFLYVLIALPFPAVLILASESLSEVRISDYVWYLPIYAASVVLSTAGISLMAIAMHRLVVLRETPSILVQVPLAILIIFICGALLADGIGIILIPLIEAGLELLEQKASASTEAGQISTFVLASFGYSVVMAVLLYLSIYIAIRMALMFPSIATSGANNHSKIKREGYVNYLWGSIIKAFSFSRGHSFRIFLVSVLSLAPLMIALLLLTVWFDAGEDVIGNAPVNLPAFSAELILCVVLSLITALGAIAVSFCYLDITRPEESDH